MHLRLIVSAFMLFLMSPAFADEPVACTMEAMRCADGSYVSRSGPHCEFSACPKSPAAPGQSHACSNMAPLRCPDGSLILPGPGCQYAACTVTIMGAPSPLSGGEDGNPGPPDESVDASPDSALSVAYVTEHRSALVGRQVTVHGYVVSGTGNGNMTCETTEACSHRVTLADMESVDRDMHYDLVVLLKPQDQTAYSNGQAVDITGVVTTSRNTVTLKKY